MSVRDAERDRRNWEPIFVNTPVRESTTAGSLRAALIDLVGERGPDGATVESLVERAQVGRDAFDDEYDSIEDCCLDTWVYLMHDFLPRTDAAYARGGDDWRECLRHQAWDFLRYLEEDINRARF